jgi:hypothetical protein
MNKLNKIGKKTKKIPAPLEIMIGGVIVLVPPIPDPSDVIGWGLIADGLRKIKGVTRKFSDGKYVLVQTARTKRNANKVKKRLIKFNYVRITKVGKERKRFGKWDVWARKRE